MSLKKAVSAASDHFTLLMAAQTEPADTSPEAQK